MFENKEKKEEKRIKGINQKVRSDLRTAFMGKGKRGLFQWLRLGKLLAPIADDEYRYYHNDRVEVIAALVGVENMDNLLSKLCDAIQELCREEE